MSATPDKSSDSMTKLLPLLAALAVPGCDRRIATFASLAPGCGNAALNHAAWTVGHGVSAGALEQAEVEGAVYAL